MSTKDRNPISPTTSDPSSITNQNETDQKEKFYGRRMGRPLRDKTKSLIERALPTYTFDVSLADDPHADFDDDGEELWLEIGCGGGEHLCGQAKSNPNVNLIGAEAFMNGISLMLRQVLDENIQNDNYRISSVCWILLRWPCGKHRKFFPAP